MITNSIIVERAGVGRPKQEQEARLGTLASLEG
jgi:hypothetical protein